MKVVLDTNVMISGIFWKGKPYLILEQWINEKIDIIVSQEILDEYMRVPKDICSASVPACREGVPAFIRSGGFLEILIVTPPQRMHKCIVLLLISLIFMVLNAILLRV